MLEEVAKEATKHIDHAKLVGSLLLKRFPTFLRT